MELEIKDRIVEIVTMKAADIQPHPLNFRKHPPKQQAVTMASLRELGKADVLKAYKNAEGKIVCLDGHLRIDLIPELEWKVAIMDFSEDEAINYITTHDQITAMADIDPALLKEALSRATTQSEHLARMFVDLARQNKIEWDSEKKDAAPSTSMAGELQAKWKTELGQIWKLGDHRIICGDCTHSDDVVAKLMRGEKAVCMWTDPPYGVNYVGKTEDAMEIETDDPETLAELLEGAYKAADKILVDGAPIYVAHPGGPNQMIFNNEFVKVGWKFHETLIWVKNSMVMGHSDYHYRHEPVMYGWKGANRFWYSGRAEDSVFEIDRPSRSSYHPTTKPVELVVAHLKNSAQVGDIIYDPFLGSGTTLIASDNLRMRCRGCELDPVFLAVIIQRWVDLTGGEPVLE